VDTAVVPDVRRQRRPAPASCAGLQSRQFLAHAGDAPADQRLVADEPKTQKIVKQRERFFQNGAKSDSRANFCAANRDFAKCPFYRICSSRRFYTAKTLKEKLIKIGAKVVSHGRYVAFQMAEVAIPRQMFQEILRLIAELRPQPPPAPA
jgi:hypothetical protein